jgi:heme a synthase
VFRASSAAATLIVVQAVLGGIVVKGDLAALLVTAHFAAAMIVAAALVYATVAAFTVEARPPLAPDHLASFARMVALFAFALLVVGAYVRGENAGLAFTDWPLMQGRLVPDLGSVGPVLMFAHRTLAVATAALVGGLAAWAWRRRASRPPVSVLASVAAGLYLGQVVIGAALVWSLLSAPARVAHVTVAGLIWGALVAAAATARVLAGDHPADRRVEAAGEGPA